MRWSSRRGRDGSDQPATYVAAGFLPGEKAGHANSSIARKVRFVMVVPGSEEDVPLVDDAQAQWYFEVTIQIVSSVASARKPFLRGRPCRPAVERLAGIGGRRSEIWAFFRRRYISNARRVSNPLMRPRCSVNLTLRHFPPLCSLRGHLKQGDPDQTSSDQLRSMRNKLLPHLISQLSPTLGGPPEFGDALPLPPSR
ncbi:MAG: hypothetical protein BJ554DRAFT_3275 [Olpidium bornovanus]|uniref:Uncharacterized protein n=1 Tax=Olpidium bornovanus TaxID=278681 RepID=A0A8H7ZPF3_9FUNG|nr:MAG: hypothetical protein BJ554DRAFT_3275 [Olpidium bornovanus]